MYKFSISNQVKNVDTRVPAAWKPAAGIVPKSMPVGHVRGRG